VITCFLIIVGDAMITMIDKKRRPRFCGFWLQDQLQNEKTRISGKGVALNEQVQTERNSELSTPKSSTRALFHPRILDAVLNNYENHVKMTRLPSLFRP